MSWEPRVGDLPLYDAIVAVEGPVLVTEVEAFLRGDL